ncbi:MAG: hypothetical protein IJV39_05070 [Ruminococcus sp.]|nr:hypothetical protein [Ruminococcus sp.]
MIYNICGLNIKFEPKYEQTVSRAEKYIAKDQSVIPDFEMNITEHGIDEYIKLYPYTNRSLAEHCLYAMALFDNILDFDGFFLHSSAIAVDGRAYLFTADSGVGKSTHSQLWMKHFKDRAVMINDDKPVIRIIDDKIYACGNPFSGKHDISANILVPLGGICCIHRGEVNSIKKISTKEALTVIMNQTLRISEKSKTIKLFDLLDRVLSNVDIYSLHCNISDEAVEVAYNAMKQV